MELRFGGTIRTVARTFRLVYESSPIIFVQFMSGWSQSIEDRKMNSVYQKEQGKISKLAATIASFFNSLWIETNDDKA